jgi:hypothetical protein
MTIRTPIERAVILLAGLSILTGPLGACENKEAPSEDASQASGANPGESGAKADEPEGLAALRYSHGPLGFSIAFPEGWDVQKDSSPFAFIGTSPQEGEEDLYGENVNIMAMTTPPGISLEDFSRDQIQQAKTVLEGYAQRGQSFEDINGEKAARFDYVHTVNDLRIVSITFIQISDDIAYAITCSAQQQDYDRYRAMLLQIARSFRFEE